jgi:hypothetical protein
MVKYPEFDKRERFGTSFSGAEPPASRVARTLEDPIDTGDRVRLRYKGKQLFVIVIRVVAPQERYEGRVQGFVGNPQDPPVLEVEDLKVNCVVGFCQQYLWR